MSRPVIIVAKDGYGVNSAYKYMKMHTQFDTHKVKTSGTMVVNLPAETLNGEERFHTVSIAHGLSYAPMAMPYIKGALYQDDLATGGDWVMNDVAEIDIPKGAYSPPMQGEQAMIKIDGNNVYLEVKRWEYLGTNQDFGARNCYMYYTVFWNQLDEDLNLL